MTIGIFSKTCYEKYICIHRTLFILMLSFVCSKGDEISSVDDLFAILENEGISQNDNGLSEIQYTLSSLGDALLSANTDKLASIQYDYIIVGAGSAGCVLANRLTEDSNCNVLILDRGRSPPLQAYTPGFTTTLWSPPTAFQQDAEPDGTFCLGQSNSSCSELWATVLGGGSGINGMIGARGCRKDYNLWAKLGNIGWDYDSLLPYFKKSEKILVPQLQNKDHGTSGPQLVGYYDPYPETNPNVGQLHQLIYQGVKETKLPYYNDIVVKASEGIGKGLGTNPGGRKSTYTTYLEPVSGRKNLHILVNARVTKILIKDNKAYGVTFYKNGQYRNVTACKDVILSAGAVNSAHLLMLSGIGPKNQLNAAGIKVIRDLDVGKFRDHMSFLGGLAFEYFPFLSIPIVNEVLDSLKQALVPVNIDAMLYYDTSRKMPDFPDVQVAFYIFPGGTPFIPIVYGAGGYRFTTAIIKEMLKFKSPLVMFPEAFILRPEVVGRLFLKNSDPFTPLTININYPKNETLQRERLNTILKIIKYFEELGETETFKSNNIKVRKLHISGCNDSWECIAKHMTSSPFHYVATCRMGPKGDPLAVVDFETLKVHGIEGLRVIDASVMPTVPAGNTNLPTIMLAEKGADIVKEDYKGKCGCGKTKYQNNC